MITLDHNATSPLRPEARSAMERALATGGNPSSVHAAGRAARSLVETARDQVAALAGVRPQDVIFTAGGTEANALALTGAVYGAIDAGARFTRLFVSAIEHDSMLATARMLAERVPGLRLEAIPATFDGTIDIVALRVMLREGKGRALVATMAANNETGVVQPIAAIADLVHEAGASLAVDAVQAAGKMALGIDADYVTLSAHKLGGPQGIGALVLRESAPFAPQIPGGGQERGRRAGTENVVGIAGFGAAAAATDLAASAALGSLRDRFETALRHLCPDAIVFGAAAPRLANTSNFALPGIAAETTLMALDLDGILLSSGAACSSGKVKSSHVLKAMGVADDVAACALRASFGWNSAVSDVDAAIAALSTHLARLRPREAT